MTTAAARGRAADSSAPPGVEDGARGSASGVGPRAPQAPGSPGPGPAGRGVRTPRGVPAAPHQWRCEGHGDLVAASCSCGEWMYPPAIKDAARIAWHRHARSSTYPK